MRITRGMGARAGGVVRVVGGKLARRWQSFFSVREIDEREKGDVKDT